MRELNLLLVSLLVNKKSVQCDVVTSDKGYFGSDPKEEQKSDLNSLSKLLIEMEDKPPPARYEIGKLKEKNMRQRDEHNS